MGTIRPATPAVFAPEGPASRRRFFYGWQIVGVGFLALAFSTGIQAYALGAFFTAMQADLGWSRTALSGAQSASTVVNGLLAPFIGPIVDRHGSRVLMTIGAVISAAGLIGMALSQDLWQFYLFRAGVFTVGILCMGTLVINTTVSKWFVRMRGRALAITAMGLSLASVIFPTLLGVIIPLWGWRWGWGLMALAVAALIPPILLVMRRRPEDMGLLPDGDAAPVPGAAAVAAKSAGGRRPEQSFTRAEALRTPALWLVIATFSVGMLGVGAINIHIIPFLTDQGVSQQAAAAALSFNGIAGLITKPFWGLAVERYPVRFCAVAEFIMLAAGIALVMVSGSLGMAYLGMFVYGVGNGGVLAVQEVVWADYFGREHLGAVRSTGIPFTIVSGAGGPLFAGWIFDVTGAYTIAFGTFIGCLLLAAALILLAKQPVKAAAPGAA